MRCPICLKELTKVQEILYYSEPVYYCPYCNSRISDVRDNDQKAKTINFKKIKKTAQGGKK
ncbi:MAG: hypothetical protein J7J77_02115 [Candidatus Cloacimonetes bacterium]|nr:hypothetical protein [Candidatus Cloacimonadota bacterium]